MSLWFLLWFVLSAIILGATLWSTVILMKQKQAWKAFAKKKDITFNSPSFFAPSEMSGIIDGFEVSFFTAEQQNPDARKNRQVTVLQINDPTFFVDGLAAGTPQTKAFIDMLDALTLHDASNTQWDKKNVLHSRYKKAVASYLTEERVKIMTSLLAFPKSDNLILMDENQGTFRFETSNPLTNEEQLETTLNKLFARIKKLRPGPEEQADFKRLRELDKKDKPVVTAPVEEAEIKEPVEDKSPSKDTEEEKSE